MTADVCHYFYGSGSGADERLLSKHPNLEAFLIFTDTDKSWENWSTEGFKSLVTN